MKLLFSCGEQKDLGALVANQLSILKFHDQSSRAISLGENPTTG